MREQHRRRLLRLWERPVHFLVGERGDPYFDALIELRRALEAREFFHLPPLVPTADGRYTVFCADRVCAAEEYVYGHKPNRQNVQEVCDVADVLAQFHALAPACVEQTTVFARGLLYELPDRYKALQAAAAQAVNNYPELQPFAPDPGAAAAALRRLHGSDYLRLCDDAERRCSPVSGCTSLSHWRVTADGGVCLADGGRVREELPVTELSQFLLHLPSGVRGKALTAYETKRPLSLAEQKILWALLAMNSDHLRLLVKYAEAANEERRESLLRKIKERNDYEHCYRRPRSHSLSRHGHRHLYLAVNRPLDAEGLHAADFLAGRGIP